MSDAQPSNQRGFNCWIQKEPRKASQAFAMIKNLGYAIAADPAFDCSTP